MVHNGFLRLAYKKPNKKRCRKCTLKKNGECRCRQGRNYESRERARKNALLLADPTLRHDRCPLCQGCHFDIDHKSADVICINPECGAILDTFGHWDYFDPRISFSKKYSTEVYWREKIRALHGTDPIIWKEDWRLIKAYIRKYVSDRELERMGQSTFSRICRSIEVDGKRPLANKKYGERFIQARMRLDLETPPPMSPKLLYMTLIRIAIYKRAHQEVFKDKYTKKNAINLNYVMLQFILMDSPEEFDTWKRWIKLSTFGKLQHYNDTWKKMIIELGTNYDTLVRDDQVLKVDWTYARLTVADLYIPKDMEIV